MGLGKLHRLIKDWDGLMRAEKRGVDRLFVH